MTTHKPAPLVWRKSSYSVGNGDCIELAWHRSTHSGGNGACVEVAPTPNAVMLRDSKSPTTPHLTIPTTHFRHFLHTLHP